MTSITTYSRKRTLSYQPVHDAFLDRTSNHLVEKSGNIQTSSRRAAKFQPSTKKIKLTQTTIDLGGNPQIKCKVCGMEYVASSPEDAKLHKRFHAESIGGIRMPRALRAGARIVSRCARKLQNASCSTRSTAEKHAPGADLIIEVHRNDGAAAKSLARKALDLAETELGAVKTRNDTLWSEQTLSSEERTTNPLNATDNHNVNGEGEKQGKQGRFKVYLYVQDERCIGICLVERILFARKVLAGSWTTDSSSISTSYQLTAAVLGVSRIWVSREHRRLSIANDLLEAALANALYGVEIGRREVAFSQPTESGRKLAVKWFGKQHGWLVYDEDAAYVSGAADHARQDAQSREEGCGARVEA